MRMSDAPPGYLAARGAGDFAAENRCAGLRKRSAERRARDAATHELSPDRAELHAAIRRRFVAGRDSRTPNVRLRFCPAECVQAALSQWKGVDERRALR